MAATYNYKGHTFSSEKELDEAKKEAEAIEYLKSRTDFDDTAMVIKLYNKLIERKMISTPVGLDFLVDLRTRILKAGIVTEKDLKPLPDITKPKKVKRKPKKEVTMLVQLKKENTYLKVTVAALVAIIVGMFIIVLTGKLTPFRKVYEEQILNEYAGWQQELKEKEQIINDKIYFLEQNGIYYEKEDTK